MKTTVLSYHNELNEAIDKIHELMERKNVSLEERIRASSRVENVGHHWGIALRGLRGIVK